MPETKIALSDKELEMVNDREWILTKQRIIQAVYHLLESVINDINELLLPKWKDLSQQSTSPPRIFKGENYLGLPYVTLDYPKLFDSDNTLTVRTMFWWGNFISVTLHAGKTYNHRLIEKIKRQRSQHTGLYVCINEDQWHHHFEADNYQLLQDISSEKLEEMIDKDFLKLAYKITLTEFNELRTTMYRHYQMLAEIMA